MTPVGGSCKYLYFPTAYPYLTGFWLIWTLVHLGVGSPLKPLSGCSYQLKLQLVSFNILNPNDVNGTLGVDDA